MDAPLSDLINRPEPEAALLRRRIEAVLTVPHPVIVADGHRPTKRIPVQIAHALKPVCGLRQD